MKLLDILRAFFRLGVGEGEPETETPEPETDEPAPDLEVDLEGGESQPEEKEDRPSAEEFAAAQAAARADRERADRAEREANDLRRQRQAPHQDEMSRREDMELADEKTPELRKWQIQANRQLRAGRTEAQAALAQANDIADRTAFRAVESKKPALYKKYEKEVEEQLVKVRQNGGNASREDIFKYLVGRDALDDKFTRKKSADKGAEKTTVARGKLPGARSDVSGKNAMSEHEKRKARLENVQI